MARGIAMKTKKKSNQNTWVFFIILFLLFQLGKFGHRNDWFTHKSKSNFETRELCLKKNKGKDISSCGVPQHFLELVDKIKKLEDKNLDKSEIDRKIIIKKIDKLD